MFTKLKASKNIDPEVEKKQKEEIKRKKEEKTWFNYLFDSCCACCSWRAGSRLGRAVRTELLN